MMNLLELSKATGLPPEDLRGILHDRYHRVVLHELAPVNTEAETELLAEYAIRSPPHPAKKETAAAASRRVWTAWGLYADPAKLQKKGSCDKNLL